MRLGQSADLRRRFTAADLAEFAALSGGAPASHVPEPLIAALFSQLLGMHLPGPGTHYLKQELTFHAPAPVNAELAARVEITRLRSDSQLVDLWASCSDPAGRLICEGRALVQATEWKP